MGNDTFFLISQCFIWHGSHSYVIFSHKNKVYVSVCVFCVQQVLEQREWDVRELHTEVWQDRTKVCVFCVCVGGWLIDCLLLGGCSCEWVCWHLPESSQKKKDALGLCSTSSSPSLFLSPPVLHLCWSSTVCLILLMPVCSPWVLAVNSLSLATSISGLVRGIACSLILFNFFSLDCQQKSKISIWTL